MSPSSQTFGELWGIPLMPNNVIVDVLMPNGIFLPVETTRECGLAELKDKVWTIAKDKPLFNLLKSQSTYVFVGVTKNAKCQEFYDERRRLCDIHLFHPILKVTTASQENREEKILTQNISQAIGFSVVKFDEIKSLEVKDFRKNISLFCKDIVQQRNEYMNNNAHAVIAYHYPPRLELSPTLPLHTAKNLLSNNSIIVKVWALTSDLFKTHACVRIAFHALPLEIIKKVIEKKSMSIIKPKTLRDCDLINHFILKVCGVNEYLVKNYPLCQYKYIRQCINCCKTPDLMLERISNVLDFTPSHYLFIEPKIVKCISTFSKQSQSVFSYTVSKLFKIRVNFGSYLNVADSLYVLANVYHGNKPLCIPQKTEELAGSEPPKWQQWLEFNIKIKNIPRCAKVSIAVCCVRKKKDERWALAWVNIPIYDFKGHLLQGRQTVRMWYPSCHMEEFLHPIGITGSNPCEETPSLELEFDSFGSVVEYADTLKEVFECKSTHIDEKSSQSTSNQSAITFESLSQSIKSITDKDPLFSLSSQEKRVLWEVRKYCSRIPESLPKLLQSVEWQKQDCVQEVYKMIKQWPYLSPETALELLDGKYPDAVVRKFATTCLEKGLTDDGYLKYLLQLVTALRFETYVDSPLVRLLLSKAITNFKIGHFLFWHLKSEMHDRQVALRYGLILEAYCRTCGGYLTELLRQTEMLEKLINLTTSLQKEDGVSQKILRDHLLKPDYEEVLRNATNPLDPVCKLDYLLVKQCEVKSSAKRPILLYWNNSDFFSKHFLPKHGILFKNGDDLRQDMLTLQILRVMDDIWQNDDLDLCISPYVCISMGQNVGMIEIVKNSATIMSIQKKGGVVGSLQLRNGTLHQWIKDLNSGDKQYHEAVNNFTRSCAGYCVATLVLGIADRHNDNIMIKTNGQMFHIDFGHFLNHKKKKYGICRNRVPFVLPGDFIRVICHGSNDVSKSEYKNFESLCCQAYMSLRKRANVIINLLSMMLGAGIPELSSFDDIEYVRSSLALEKSPLEAYQHFTNCLAAAQNKQWTTKVDWVCHAVRRSVCK